MNSWPITLDDAIEEIQRIQGNARGKNDTTRQRWPMIVCVTRRLDTGERSGC